MQDYLDIWKCTNPILTVGFSEARRVVMLEEWFVFMPPLIIPLLSPYSSPPSALLPLYVELYIKKLSTFQI
ncbi:hypothetical protein A3K73_05815 [Candidatus Pacearchaeota archaeon RBG_13_36_9]|nr:MAG: hypothetical protein A3K73_05815 [Candidatus Pacearchaeota archaeon RBG_13_36_9]